MAKEKTSSKAQQVQKKGSKLASLKSAFLSVTKKKAMKPAGKPEKAAQKNDKKPVVAKPAPAPAKKSAAPAPAPAPVAKGRAGKAVLPAKEGKKARNQKNSGDMPERMAGPSIRTTYDANGEAVCREVACEGLATTNGYCRLHYIKNWKKIKRKELILKEGKLNQYIEELVAKYPDKYIEAIRQDLANDKDFAKVIYDLDLDESVDDFEVEGENVDSLIDTIKRDFDDEGESGF